MHSHYRCNMPSDIVCDRAASKRSIYFFLSNGLTRAYIVFFFLSWFMFRFFFFFAARLAPSWLGEVRAYVSNECITLHHHLRSLLIIIINDSFEQRMKIKRVQVHSFSCSFAARSLPALCTWEAIERWETRLSCCARSALRLKSACERQTIWVKRWTRRKCIAKQASLGAQWFEGRATATAARALLTEWKRYKMENKLL